MQAVKWTMMLSQIASRLHENTPYPIIHRDIKPGNVILEDNDSIHLTGFGSARYISRKALQLIFHQRMLPFSSHKLGKTVVACTVAAMTILVGAIIWLTNPIDQQAMAVNNPAGFSDAPLCWRHPPLY